MELQDKDKLQGWVGPCSGSSQFDVAINSMMMPERTENAVSSALFFLTVFPCFFRIGGRWWHWLCWLRSSPWCARAVQVLWFWSCWSCLDWGLKHLNEREIWIDMESQLDEEVDLPLKCDWRVGTLSMMAFSAKESSDYWYLEWCNSIATPCLHQSLSEYQGGLNPAWWNLNSLQCCCVYPELSALTFNTPAENRRFGHRLPGDPGRFPTTRLSPARLLTTMPLECIS